MTSQEVRALIDAKIKGQGTNVDAGSVLPAILNGILDLIDSGGGGGTSDAVQYIPQTLTSPQQMQARKNQGLYYSEGGGEDVTLAWDGDTTGLETVGGLYKLSEDAPLASEVKSVSLIQNGVEQTYEVGVSPTQIVEVEGGYAIGDLACLVITADEVTMQGTTYTKGIWFVYGDANNRTSQLVYGQTETVHQIPSKYIPQTIPAVKIEVPSQNYEFYNIGHTVLNNWVRSRDVKFSVDIEGFHLSWLSIVDMSDPTNTIEGEKDSDTYTFTSAGSYLVTLNLEDSVSNSRNISAILVVIDIGS